MAKRKKISIKKTSRFIVIVLLITIVLCNIKNIRNFYLSKITGYNTETISVMLENNIYQDIKEHEYSQTLETILNTEYYQDKYLKDYLNINYNSNISFLPNISILLDKGYNHQDINSIYNILSSESINILIENNYLKDISNILSISYFKEENLTRYIKYYEKIELDVETIVTYVNIGLDNEYYSNVSNIEDEDNIAVLVNKYHKLSSTFIPDDLQNVSYGNGKLTKEAALAFDKMCLAAREDKIYIYGGSGYRSYNYQANLYNRYVSQDGKTKADTYAARAGFSEHQTGLAMDILNGRWTYIEESDKEFTWLKNNSYKYGFILRYLEGKEEITGYVYEPWHFRYIGIELATELTQQEITYEEYLAKKS